MSKPTPPVLSSSARTTEKPAPAPAPAALDELETPGAEPDPSLADELLPVDLLVRRLHEGKLNPDELPLDLRHLCVNHLVLEGFSTSEIAQLMHVSERTARRDRIAARRANAMRPDRLLADELLGEFQALTLSSIQRLIRLSRNAETAQYVRLWAEEAVVRNYQRLIDTVSRLGYLEEGGGRLAHERETDPAELERYRQRNVMSMKKIQALIS